MSISLSGSRFLRAAPPVFLRAEREALMPRNCFLAHGPRLLPLPARSVRSLDLAPAVSPQLFDLLWDRRSIKNPHTHSACLLADSDEAGVRSIELSCAFNDVVAQCHVSPLSLKAFGNSAK